jgi:two-component system, cell cycle response regulator
MKILIVDGDQLFARLMRTKLEKWGHAVFVETDGAAAYERIRKEPFRMVFLDWDLPSMSGPDLCRRIRELKRPRYTYIIFYTTKADKDSLMAGLQAGADDYLIKPLNTLELRLRMKNGKRLLNLEDELREGAGTDRATGVVNGASFRQFFRVTLAEAKRTQSRGALMFVTVENHDQVFSGAGVGPANNLMAEVAKMLCRNVRESDLVARLDRQQFCVLLQNTWWDKCLPVAQKIESQAKNLSVVVDDVPHSPRLSLAVVDYPQGEAASDELLNEKPRVPYAA